MPEYIVSTFDYLILSSQPKFLNIELKKIRKRIMKKKSNRQYYEKNRERERERKRKWKEENLEMVKESNRQYYEKNREKAEARKKKWRANNPEKLSKQGRKNAWKRAGVNMDFFEEIYEIYFSTTHCDLCGVELTDGKKMSLTTKCLDHSHVTGEVRNILCNKCNLGLPKHS